MIPCNCIGAHWKLIDTFYSNFNIYAENFINLMFISIFQDKIYYPISIKLSDSTVCLGPKQATKSWSGLWLGWSGFCELL